MLGKKTGVLFTISSVNFELKQGIEYRSLQLLRIPRLSLSPCLSLSLPLCLSLSLSLRVHAGSDCGRSRLACVRESVCLSEISCFIALFSFLLGKGLAKGFFYPPDFGQ